MLLIFIPVIVILCYRGYVFNQFDNNRQSVSYEEIETRINYNNLVLLCKTYFIMFVFRTWLENAWKL